MRPSARLTCGPLCSVLPGYARGRVWLANPGEELAGGRLMLLVDDGDNIVGGLGT